MTTDNPHGGAEQPEQELPHDIECEQLVLGAVLLAPEVLDQMGWLRPGDFYDPVHGRIFDICQTRHERGEPVSAIVLRSAMGDDPGLAELGGTEYLGRLAASAVTIAGAPDVARDVRELATRRQVIAAMQEAEHIARLRDTGGGAAAAISRLDDDLDLIRADAQVKPASVSLGEAMTSAMDRMEAARSQGPGISTGFPSLDKPLGGLYGGHLTVLAGRPGMGKTATAICIAQRMTAAGYGVAVCSLEMTAEDMGLRIASERLRARSRVVSYSSMMRGYVSNDEALDAHRVAADAAAEKLDIIGSHVRRLGFILSEFRRIARRHRTAGRPVGALVIDHIGLVEVPKALNDNARISAVTASLKGLAMELNVPVVALSQLNRAVEVRGDKRPMLADLRDSGSVEQDADEVIFAYRPEYYLAREMPEEDSEDYPAWQFRMERARGKLQLIVAKNRAGPLATVSLGCHLPTNAIFEPEPEDRELPF